MINIFAKDAAIGRINNLNINTIPTIESSRNRNFSDALRDSQSK